MSLLESFGLPTPPGRDRTVVLPEEYLTDREAQRLLGLRFVATVRLRRASGYLAPCVLHADAPLKDRGVTRESVAADLRWRQNASPMQRLVRHIWTLI